MPKTIDELKVTSQTIWKVVPREHINSVLANFTKCLIAYMVANAGHFEHLNLGSISKSVSSSRPKMAFFTATHILPEKTTSVMLKTSNYFSQGRAAAFSR